jgi:hypothetical protein
MVFSVVEASCMNKEDLEMRFYNLINTDFGDEVYENKITKISLLLSDDKYEEADKLLKELAA